MIDIEGLTYFDVEWEHAFLRMRFPARAYAGLNPDAVDEARVNFYRFAQLLSLIEGPLRIAETDLANRAWMRDLAESKVAELRAAVGDSRSESSLGGDRIGPELAV